jgi:iron complex outermembrane receptor protein
MAMLRHVLAVVLSAAMPWISSPAQAGTLAGRVVDAETGGPLAGVELRVPGPGRSTLSDAAGRFAFADLPAGRLELVAVRVGYEPAKLQVGVAAAADSLPPVPDLILRLRAVAFREDPIVVSATRVQRRDSPVPYANLSRQELDERYTTQDLPVLLSELPSAVYYSESGNGLGYSYFSLRGFDQRRISVLVNGVPQNDPEDQNVYWVDFPDLTSNLQDIQVQRGAGSGFYGPPAIGGSVNLVTSVFGVRPGVRLATGGGSFDTQKYSAELHSGLVDGTYAFYGRYSRLLSDGYRRDAWVDLTSFFFGAARYGAGSTTRLHVYGGPIADGLAYYGVPRQALDDRAARRQNVLAGGEQIENFSQPHYELLHEWRASDHIKISNTLFYVQGDGFFDFDASWADTTYLRLTAEHGFHPSANPGQALIRAFVGNKHGGWLPRVDLQHARGSLSLGAEVRVHRSLHWGAVRWAENLPPEAAPGQRFYRYRGGKDVVGAYAHETLRLTPGLQAMADLQLVYNRMQVFDEDFVGTDFETPFFFANPRLGLNWNATSTLHGFASYGHVRREPRLVNLYDAAESSGGATPQFEARGDGSLDFEAPIVGPESLHDFEVGAGWRTPRASLDLNLFWMDFHDEIVKSGRLDRFGQPVTGNARRSVHRGAELQARLEPAAGLELTGNLSWSRNLFEDHVVFEDAAGDAAPGGIQLGGNRIAGFPDVIANLRLTGRARGATASIAGRWVGAFFTTQFEAVDRQVPEHFVLDAEAAYGFRTRGLQEVRLRLQVRNLLDRLYVLGGEGDDYFPAATRSVFAGLELGI